MTKRANRIANLFLAAVLCSAGLSAQTIYGSLAGTVFDPTGAVIPKAKVVVRSLDTGWQRELTTDEAGFWRVPALIQGRYAVEASAPGFETLVRSPILVEPTVERRVDLTLNPGQTTEVVTVQAEAPLIESTKAQLSRGVDSTAILALPGLNTLNGLALLAPGTLPNSQGRPGSGFVVNGARSRSNNFMIDGANNNDQSLSTPRQTVAPEVLAEFRIITNNFSAEFGRNSGSVVQQITRSGTNEYHGILRWSWLGNGLDALTTGQQRTFNAQKAAGRSDYDALRRSRGVLVRNQGVASGGGPIKKNHTFFFTSYDFDLRRSSASPVVTTISPEGYAALEANRAAFAPGAVEFLKKWYPVANDPTPRGSLSVRLPDGRTITVPLQQYNRASAEGTLPYARNFHRGFMKVDSKLTDNDSLSVRYAIDDDFDPGAPNALKFNQIGSAGRNQNGAIHHVRVFRPTLIAENRAVYGRRSFHFPENLPPQFSITGSGLPVLGNANFPQYRTDNLYEFSSTWSWIRGRHSFRYGAHVLRYQLNSFFAPNIRGTVTYPSFSDFLFDRNASFSQYAGTGLTPARTTEFAGYFGDDFRVTSSVTLNLGIRYEYTGTPFGYFSNARPDINNWAPRFGFAWSPRGGGWLTGNGKLAVRGGYAISYDQIFQNILLNNSRNYPRGVTVTLDGISGRRLWDPANFPSPPTPEDFVRLGGNPNLLPVRLYSPDKRVAQPYGQQFSFGIERQLYQDFALKIFYVGSRGVKLVREVEANLGFTAAAINANPSVYQSVLPTLKPVVGAGGVITAYRRDPDRGSILVGDGYAQSVYHSLQVSFDKRFRRGLQFQNSYTWSSFINDSDDILGGQANRTLPSNPLNLRHDRGRSGYDQPHRFTSGYIYEFPNIREGRGVLGRIAGGWSLSGVTTVASGTPYSIFNSFNALGILPGQISTIHLSQRASYNPAGPPKTGTNPTIPTPRFIANPANSGIVGNLGANTERVGRTVNFDAALSKRITTWADRGHALELRWEVFNALNHRNFVLIPANTVSANTDPTTFMNLGFTDVGGRGMLFNVRYHF